MNGTTTAAAAAAITVNICSTSSLPQ